MKRISLVLSLVLLLTLVAVSVDSDRKYIVLRRDAAKNAPFSEAVLAGNTLYIAGHLGIDPKTGKPGATPEEEARLVMESLKRTVEASGFNMDDIVSVQVFCSDVSVFDAFNSVYRTYFHENYPARAFIGAGKLLFGARFEVQGIAVKK
ncbi:MAG TPA: Rid family hydrolase [Candidatus Angelobacter sp.]|jgi:reactive intermediate/imine deaminase|nr:Rid family hydrolase [Candidatus Angelobacter sp.]